MFQSLDLAGCGICESKPVGPIGNHERVLCYVLSVTQFFACCSLSCVLSVGMQHLPHVSGPQSVRSTPSPQNRSTTPCVRVSVNAHDARSIPRAAPENPPPLQLAPSESNGFCRSRPPEVLPGRPSARPQATPWAHFLLRAPVAGPLLGLGTRPARHGRRWRRPRGPSCPAAPKRTSCRSRPRWTRRRPSWRTSPSTRGVDKRPTASGRGGRHRPHMCDTLHASPRRRSHLSAHTHPRHAASPDALFREIHPKGG